MFNPLSAMVKTLLVMLPGLLVAIAGSAALAQGAESDATIISTSPTTSGDAAWAYSLNIYLWGAGTDTRMATGVASNLTFRETVDNLAMGYMARAKAHRDRWAFGVDIIYEDLEFNGGGALLPAGAEVGLKEWVVTPTLGYTTHEGGWGSVSVLGGVRFLDQEVDARLPAGAALSKVSTSDQFWAGIVGMEGEYRLAEDLFFSWYGDVGTGDPDLTWQLFAGLGYHFSAMDLIVGYRYLRWEFASGETLAELKSNGPLVGLRFTF